MKRFFILFTMITTMVVMVHADDGSAAAINLEYREHDNHLEHYAPADMPEVYFDADGEEIIIVADGFADYYEVDIVSQSTMLAVISTQIGGYGDTIDISSLPDDNYTIIITSSNNNVYQGQFTNHQQNKTRNHR